MSTNKKLFSIFLSSVFFASLLFMVLLFFSTKTVVEPKEFSVVESELVAVEEKDEDEVGSKIIFDPEIPVNEYWDRGEFNDLNLYINNTDKNVIYALDDYGKIAWTIWGEKYGIDGFEVIFVGDKLFIKDSNRNENGESWDMAWIFDGEGALKWKHTFKGYLDLPQSLVTNDNYLILENRADNKCNAGCGVMCEAELQGYCYESNTWAFDLDTGKVMWRINTPNYFGHYLRLRDDGKIVANSGGVGPGRLQHSYIVNNKTGVIESQAVSIDDREFNQDTENALTYDLNAKQVYLHERWTDNRVWTLGADSSLYNLVVENLNGQYKTVILDEGIMSYRKTGDKNQVSFFSKDNGGLLWEKEYEAKDFNIAASNIGIREGLIFIGLYYQSPCNEVCEVCSGWICISQSDSEECQACRIKDKTRSDYMPSTIWALSALDGSIKWERQGGIIKEVLEDRIATYESGDLDLKTGKVIEEIK